MSEHKAGDATQAHAILAELRKQMASAYHHGQPLYLQGGNTCRFYGHPVPGMPVTPTGSPVAVGQTPAADGCAQPDGSAAQATVIDCRRYSGIVQYEPTELVVTVRCGTPLEELEAVLAERGPPSAVWWPPVCRDRAAPRPEPCATSSWARCWSAPMAG